MCPLPLASSLGVLVWPVFILFSYNGITVHRRCTETPGSILQMIKLRPLHHGSPYLALGKQLSFLFFLNNPYLKSWKKLMDLFSSAGFSRNHNLNLIRLTLLLMLHFPAWDTYLRTETINR